MVGGSGGCYPAFVNKFFLTPTKGFSDLILMVCESDSKEEFYDCTELSLLLPNIVMLFFKAGSALFLVD